MLEITCPFCGPRSETEYINGGPSKVNRAESPDGFTDSEWVDYLILAPNPLGPVKEEWCHIMGCSLWFTITRDTVTHEILPSPETSNE
ncbi:MAG: sarcosine oxidase subunit delta [Porticoccaceae bacterium]|jgi:heterotetrameric sarcosine oxidase delta subunit|nr:sarcosine oxidase subunit delta [Porticoccaceae bacterium]